jgi:hypothetical protein
VPGKKPKNDYVMSHDAALALFGECSLCGSGISELGFSPAELTVKTKKPKPSELINTMVSAAPIAPKHKPRTVAFDDQDL